MPANKSNHSTPSKEKPINGRKRRSSSLKHRKHSRTHLLHSEYRSTYTWHEYTGNQEHTVVRRAPQAPPTIDTSAKLQSAKSIEDDNSEGTSLEPPLPRRKKNPELAYRTHEFISATGGGGGGVGGGGGGGGGGIDALDSNVVADKVREATKVLPASQLSKAISRISTEYRLQFAWPRRQQPQLTNGDVKHHGDDHTGDQQQQQQVVPRKSLSMGALRQGSIIGGGSGGGLAPAPVHKKRQGAGIDHRRGGRDGAQASELEPLVTTDGALPEADEHDELDASVVAPPAPVAATTNLDLGLKKPVGRAVRITTEQQPLQENKYRKKSVHQEKPMSAAEVLELRRELKRLADEYKHRDWGGGIAGEVDEATLWKRVSNNHALNALSLARSATKEEKEKENTRKVAPATATIQPSQILPAGRPSSVQARPIHQTTLSEDLKPDNDRSLARARKDFLIRHHLDRTTGAGDGALLPSPTREKLEPAMPRKRDAESADSQSRSKSSPKNSPRSARSQSVGPSIVERRSPKRRPQSVAKDKDGREKSSERHPRPSSVSRWKTRDTRSSKLRSESANRIRSRTGVRPPVTIKPSLATNAPPHHHQRSALHHNNHQQQLKNNATERPKSGSSANRVADATSSTTTTTATTTTSKPLTASATQPSHSHQQFNARPAAAAAATTGAVRPGSLGVGYCSKQQHHPQPDNNASNAVRANRAAATADHHHHRYSKSPKPLRHSQAGQAMTAEPQVNGQHPHQQQQDGAGAGEDTPSPASQGHPQLHRAGWIDDEPVVKSPPEPTRVKSPEQMIMRSPEPVNWTVPLDTGKTFTVTQNVREGEPPTRAHSEARSWIGPGAAMACQSAPPELDGRLQQQQHQQKLQEHKQQEQQHKSPESEKSISLGSFSGTNGHKDSQGDSPLAKDEEHQLADELDSKAKKLDQAAGAPVAGEQQHASDLLEMARNRFDKFWGSGKDSEQ